MKGTAVLLLIALVGLSQAIDYTNQATEFGSGTCATAPSDAYISPIMIQSTKCGSYDEFSLQLKDVVAGTANPDTAKGSYRIDYTDGSLTYDGTTYTSQYILFRSSAEHVLFSAENRADVEMQIYLEASNGDKAAIAFLFKDIGTDAKYKTERTRAAKALNVITKADNAGTYDLMLSAIPKSIESKLANDVFLNFYTYDGTQTFPSCDRVKWFVYASELYTSTDTITDITTNLNTGAGTLSSSGWNTRLFSNAGGYQPAEHLCYTGYFQVRMDVNYGLWFSIGILLLFFIFTLSMDNTPINNVDYKENGWTHHPIYSIWKVGNDIFTKKSRSAMVLIACINSALWNSVWYRVRDNLSGAYIIENALATIPIGWVSYYMIGFFLRKYYIYKAKYEQTNDENFDNKAQFYIFIYYFGVFIGIWIGFGFCVWNMNELQAWVNTTASNYWIASFFITLGLEFLVFDIIAAWLCTKITWFRNWCKWKGMIYDDLCHDTYLRAIKRE